jgi:hypothetical protein
MDLKKPFQKRDVTRIRNIVQGKSGEKTISSIGYSKPTNFHEEGDVWEELGKTWTIKDGVKQNVIKAKILKDSIILPLFCPSCGDVMTNPHDKDFYKIHKTCFNCVITKESELKRTGQWEEYQKNIHNDEIDNKIREYKIYVEDKLNENNNSFVSEDGVVEKWVGKLDKDRVDNNTQEVIDYLISLKK